MKAWIKDVLKSKQFGYLSLRIENQIRILPYSYVYESGRLFGSLRLIQAEEILSLKNYPTHALSVVDSNYTIDMIGRVKLYDSDLDIDWLKTKNIRDLNFYDRDRYEIANYTITHLNKQVGVEFGPSQIVGFDGQERIIYDMEILL